MVSATVDLSKPLQEIQDSLEMATSILEKAVAEGWSRSTFCKAIGVLDHRLNGESDIKHFMAKENTIIIDYGSVNLKSLIITNDLQEYKKRKAQSNIGVLFEPKLMEGDKDESANFYAIGVLVDT